MMEQVRVGVIGVGNMGSGHCRTLSGNESPGLQLAAAADLKASRRDWVLENTPGVAVFGTAEELMDSGLCDAVIIAVPHYDHPRLALYAMAKGLHVMCEKPAGVYTLQVRDMMAAADRHPELTFGMMFNQRTNCVYRRLKQLIDEGELGEIKRVNWIITDWYRSHDYYKSGAWRATWAGEGGGVLLNQCPHNLDLLQWLCGMPTSVQAFCHEGKWHDIEVEDDVTAYLEYANGATGVFVTTTGDMPGTNRLEITGTRGKAVCTAETLALWQIAEDVDAFYAAHPGTFSIPAIDHQVVETDGQNPQHAGVLRAFAGNILRGEPLVADGREGIHGLMLSNAMHLSSWLGEKITLPFDEQLFLDELNKRREKSRYIAGDAEK